MLLWSEVRTRWHCHTPKGKETRRRSQRRYSRTEKGKAQRATYVASEAGKAAVKRGTAEQARKRRVAKGQAQQALYDSWAQEDAIDDV
jgi:hypothetical protein